MNGNALAYILRTKLKNNLKEFVKRPSRLILTLIFIALFGITIFSGSAASAENMGKFRDISELTAGITALLLIIFATTFYSGFDKGGSIFSMSDVNFLFPSPLNKRSVMFFGLIQRMGTSLFIGLFILFQYTMLHSVYGVTLWGMFLIFIVYSLTAFLGQTCAMFLYIFTSDSDRKKKLAKTIFFAYIAILCAYVGIRALGNTDNIMATLVNCVNSLVITSFPFAGWLSAFVGGIFTASYVEAALWLVLTAAAFCAVLVGMSRSKREYYEDVLASTETAYNALCAVKEGTTAEPTPRNIKVGKTGIGKGVGASVMYYKHRIESRRAGRLFLSPSALIFALMTIGFSFLMKKAGIVAVLSFATYMQIFTVAAGRFNLELMKPYIYLIPEPPLKKLIHSLYELFPTALIEGILIFVPVSIILNLSPLDAALTVLVRVSFALLFTAGSIAVERIWGGSLSKLVGVLLYFVIDFVIAIPGIALFVGLCYTGLVAWTMIPAMLICLAVGNVLTSVLVLFLCRNMLQYAEI